MPKLIALARRAGDAVHLIQRNIEHFAGGAGVDVLAGGEGFAQGRDIRHVGEKAQFDLAVIGADQHIAGLGHENAADAGTFFRADRDVLQIGVVAGNAAGAGGGHGVAGVDAAGAGIDFLHQRIGVGGFELCELAPFQHAAGKFMALVRQRLQHAGIRAPGAGRRALAAGEFQFVEQHLAKLLGTAEAERAAGEFMGIDFHRRHAGGEIGGHAAQFGRVYPDAGTFHFG